MKKNILFISEYLLLFLFIMYQGIYASECPLKGDKFPDITISTPQNNIEKAYLGLETMASFKLSKIKADILIIEIFSMYCPYCQKEAPAVNDLFKLIEQRSDLKDKIKIIGIGAGNSLYEINVFRDTYNVLFPLFADESYSIHKMLGEVRTPYFFVLKMNADGSNKIIYSKAGSIDDPEQFLDFILKESI